MPSAPERRYSYEPLMHQPPVLFLAKALVDVPPRKPAGDKRRANRDRFCAFDCMARFLVIEHGAVAIENNLLNKIRHGRQIIHGVQAKGVVPPIEIPVGAAAILRWAGARAADADRISPAFPTTSRSSMRISCSHQPPIS